MTEYIDSYYDPNRRFLSVACSDSVFTRLSEAVVSQACVDETIGGVDEMSVIRVQREESSFWTFPRMPVSFLGTLVLGVLGGGSLFVFLVGLMTIAGWIW